MAVNNAAIIKNFLSIFGVMAISAIGSAYVLGNRGNKILTPEVQQQLNQLKEKTQKAQDAVRLVRTVHV